MTWHWFYPLPKGCYPLQQSDLFQIPSLGKWPGEMKSGLELTPEVK
jgi:hypothetical protein